MAVVLHQALNRPASPRVSICIANFNGERMLGDCIESIVSQDTDADIEILVHDDASTDASVDFLRKRYPQASLLVSDRNVGFCTANNRMAAAARGEYLLLLNNDAALQADAIRMLLEEAARIPGPAILTLPQSDWETGALVDRGCLLDPFHTPVPNLDPHRHDVAYVIGACLWIPRTTWNELGGFPEWLGSIAEDMYLCCAARLRRVPVRCLGESGYRHRQGASFGGNRIDRGRLSTSYRRRRLSERNRIAVVVSCTPTWLVWPWLVVHLTVLVAEGVLLALIKRDRRLWRDIYQDAILDAWRGRRAIFSLRDQVQGARTARLSGYLRGFTWMPRKPALLLRHGLPALKD